MAFGNPGDRLAVLIPYMVIVGILAGLIAGIMTQSEYSDNYRQTDDYLSSDTSGVDTITTDKGISVDDIEGTESNFLKYMSNLISIVIFDFNMNFQSSNIRAIWFYIRIIFIWFPTVLLFYSIYQSGPVI